MALIREDFEKETLEAWKTFIDSLDKALTKLEQELEEGKEMLDICTDEWCQATEHYIDDIGNALFGPTGWDPYLENPGTLWLLHWHLVNRWERASTWFLAFTRWTVDSLSA